MQSILKHALVLEKALVKRKIALAIDIAKKEKSGEAEEEVQ